MSNKQHREASRVGWRVTLFSSLSLTIYETTTDIGHTDTRAHDMYMCMHNMCMHMHMHMCMCT